MPVELVSAIRQARVGPPDGSVNLILRLAVTLDTDVLATQA